MAAVAGLTLPATCPRAQVKELHHIGAGISAQMNLLALELKAWWAIYWKAPEWKSLVGDLSGAGELERDVDNRSGTMSAPPCAVASACPVFWFHATQRLRAHTLPAPLSSQHVRALKVPRRDALPHPRDLSR